MMNVMLTLTHATERDIDLLIIEELKCSRVFVEWFIGEIARHTGIEESFDCFDVIHSKRRIHTRREIDITLTLSSGKRRVVALIENKLDTAPQPKQAESYRDEAAALVAGGADAVWTVLVCPYSYAGQKEGFSAGFDCVVTYEAIATHLSERSETTGGELAARLVHRAKLMDQAVTKARRGYEVVPLAPIGRFAARYVELLRSDGVDLPPGPAMLRSEAGGESKTMIFSPSALPGWPFLPQTRLVHQLREANANICLYTWGDLFTHLAGVIATDLLGTPYRLVPTINKRSGGRSGLMLVADTPVVDNLANFDEQIESIREGQRVTLALRDWFSARSSVVERWAARVTELNAQPRTA